MGDVPHKKGVVEGDGVGWEEVGVVEVGGFYFLDFEWGGLPVGDFEKESVEAGGVGAGGIANAAIFEEAG